MKTKVAVSLILAVLIYSCGKQHKNPDNIRSIVLKKTDEIQPISGFVSGVEYFELVFPEVNKVIGKVEELKILDNDFLIKHRFSREIKLLRFSAEGSFLNEINTSGNDYPRDIVAFNDGYAVWDSSAVYQISKTGEQTEKLFEARLPGNRFFFSKSNFYFFHENATPGLLSEYSTEGKQERIYSAHNQGFEPLTYAGVTVMGKDSFHLFSPVLDTVFAFSGNTLSAKYLISGREYPTYNKLLKKADKSEPIELLRYVNSNQHWVITRFLENRNFIFVAYKHGSNPFSLLIRKSNWETLYVKTLINDVDGGVWADPVYLSDDDVLYIPLSPYQVTGHEIKNRKRHSFEDVQKETEANDNPVIMMCKLK